MAGMEGVVRALPKIRAVKGAAGERRNAGTAASFLQPWRRSARAAALTLSSPDGRWALVSTSVTAVIAGTITWLAAGAAVPSNYDTGRSRLLIPYELFQRLTGQAHGTDYAVIGPLGQISSA